MLPRPNSIGELRDVLLRCAAEGTQIESLDMGALDRVVEHLPEDMTATVQSGVSALTLQETLGAKGQWLPIDPAELEKITVRDLLDQNLNGPRRYGYGVIRDYVIGLTVMLADGRLIRSGGKVVKNVAGYDLAKVFIGAQGTLGVIVEVTFKLRPIPDSEAIFGRRCASLAEAAALLEQALATDFSPTVLDMHNMAEEWQKVEIVIAFDGSREDVAAQSERAAALGFKPARLDYWPALWREAKASPKKLSVLPSKTVETIADVMRNNTRFVAHVGNGIIHYSGTRSPNVAPQSPLGARLKATFDPNGLFPEFAQ